MADRRRYRPGIFDEDRSGFAFSEVFTPTREGPLRPRPGRSGVGGPSLGADGKPIIPGGGAHSVWSAADAAANGMTLSNGGLTIASNPAGGTWRSARTTISKTSGKLYVEFLCVSPPTDQRVMFGLASSGFNIAGYMGSSIYSTGIIGEPAVYVSAGFTANYVTSLMNSIVSGDVIALAVDFSSGAIYVSYNNAWAYISNPATGASPIISFVPATVGALFAGLSTYAANNVWTLQATAASQKYAPPAGFSAWDGGPVTPVTSVWSASDATAGGMTLSNNGLTVENLPGTASRSVRSTVSHLAGKFYIEFFTEIGWLQNYSGFGFASAGASSNAYFGDTSYGATVWGNTTAHVAGFTALYDPTYAIAENKTFSFAIDFDAGKVWFAIDGVWVNSSNPATGSLPMWSFVSATVGPLFAGLSFYSPIAGKATLKATTASQRYLPPAGFQAWDGGPVTPTTSVWSASDAAANGMTLSNGGLTVTPSLATWNSIRSSISNTTGKLYVEFYNTAIVSNNNIMLGLASSGFNIGSYLGSSNYSCALWPSSTNTIPSTGFAAGAAWTGGITPAQNDTWALAVDFSAGKMWLAQNNIWLNSGVPSSGASPIATFVPATVGPLFAAFSFNGGAGNGTWTIEPTAASQKYAPPAGFSAWDGGAAVVGHRYWQINGLYSGGLPNASMAEIQFRTTAGTPLLFSGGTASASTIFGAGNSADKAADNNPSTLWSSANSDPAPYWRYDYGAGNAKSIVEITIQARNDAVPGQTPSFFIPQWSDDGTTWTSMGPIDTAPWALGQIQTFPVAPNTPQALAYLARTVGGNEGGNGANIATLIDGLVSDGVWAKLDCLYVLAQQNADGCAA